METSGDTKLTVETWKNLTRLTAENISADQLSGILQDIAQVSTIDHLTEAQAKDLIRALSPLEPFSKLCWEAIVEAISVEQQKLTKPMSTVEAIAIADLVLPTLLDRLSVLFAKNNVTPELFPAPADI